MFDSSGGAFHHLHVNGYIGFGPEEQSRCPRSPGAAKAATM
jgi:hypothetical protein